MLFGSLFHGRRKGKMKKAMKKMMALVLTAAVLATAAMPVSAAISRPKTLATYLGPDGKGDDSINISGLKSDQSLTPENVKTSAKSVVGLEYINNSTHKTEFNYWSGENASGGTTRESTIGLILKKPGKSTISYTIGTKTYTTKVTVLKYVNPLSSLTITGINNGKTIHKKFAKNKYATIKLPKTVSKARITAKARSGWAVKSLSVYNGRKSYEYESDGVTTAQLRNIKLSKGKQSCIDIELKNKSNKGTISLQIEIEG